MTVLADMIKARVSLDPFGRPSAEKVASYLKMRAALNAEAKENWENEKWHRQIAAVIASRLDYGFTFTNLFPTYFATKQVGETDIVTLRERRGLQVFWTARGGYIDESQLKTEQWELPRDTIGFHVSEFDDKLRNNFAETIDDLVNLADMRLDAEINRRMFNLLQYAVPSSSPYYVNLTSGLTKAALDQAVRDVQDAIKPNNGTMPPVTIAGRAAVIDALSNVVTDPSALYDPAATDEIRRLGRLGVYRGANVIRIQNYTDENDESYMPANELWVFGGTVGLFAKYGGMITRSWEENTVDYRHYRGRCDVGGLVNHPEQARRLVDGTITA